MPYIGNQPFGKTVRTVTTETIASAKTAYYPNGGYMAGYVDVYVNGVRLSESLDFTATDGSLVTLLYTPNIGDTVEIVTYGSVEIANAVRRSGDTFSGNVYVGSNVYISTSTISVGNATVNTQITAGNIALNGSTLTIGNSTVNTVFTGDTVTVGGTLSLGNTTITGTANVTTAINVGANVSMNTTSIRVGNSTINTYIVSDTIYGPSTLYIDPAAAGDNTGLVVVKGDLQVDGTTFTINSANVTVNDKNVVLASGAINNAATDGAGLTIYGTNANLTYNATGNNFEMSRGLSVTGTANVSTAINVGANVNLSTSQINVGNSTVNTTITNITVSTNTVNVASIINVGANVNLSTSQINIGNSTVNTVITSASLSTNSVTITGGTANGVAYLNGSKVLTTGSALTFDGTVVNNIGAAPSFRSTITGGSTYTSLFSDGVYTTGTDLYLLAPSGKFISFYANNSEKMRLGAATGGVGALGIGYTSLTSVGDNGLAVLGNVGIGTSSPSVKFQTVQTTADWTGDFKNYTAGAYGLRVDLSGSSGVQAALQVYTATGNGIVVKNNGLVGIGTFSPTWKLEVNADQESLASFRRITTTTGAGYARFINQGGTFYIGVDSSNGTRISGSGLAYAASMTTEGNTALTFGTNNTNRMTINTTGNVGIGTNTPVVQLHVGSYATYGGGNGEIELASNSSGWGSVLFGDGGTGSDYYRGYLQYQHNGDYMLFGTAATERMRIDSAGRVTKPYQPNFRASTGSSSIVAKADVVFTNKDWDVGSNYSTSTGRFTAPIAGYYMFTLSALYMTNGSSPTWKVNIMKNGGLEAVMGEWQTTALGGYNTMFNAAVIVSLAANDYVNIYHDGTTTSASVHISGGQTKFCGYLLG